VLALCAAVLVFGWVTGRVEGREAQEGAQTRGSGVPVEPGSGRAPVSGTEIHFAPEENLEKVDLALIQDAKNSVDVAMYTFTDRKLAAALVTAARRGVQVRIYRDHSQFQSEQRRGGQALRLLWKQPNLHIKVKASRELMHEKSFAVDRRILRAGSANWSQSGARYQDNEITITGDPREVTAFERKFAAMWGREDNEAIQ
jgi:phosphatidylserine/phosphatidylglycerophosphate/cardiolipin synthase-like enzyme